MIQENKHPNIRNIVEICEQKKELETLRKQEIERDSNTKIFGNSKCDECDGKNKYCPFYIAGSDVDYLP